mmetsp:Transcript_12390/g.20616  ORF Transcript_12390/g.20616 Transcript_12390/m.20616 type:complete len:109 (-) Transcript_12390:248-574(-)
MDIRGAFMLVDIKVSDDELLMLFGCVGFGCSGLPGAFHVLTLAIKWELKQVRRSRGDAEMYVDNLFGIGWARLKIESMMWRELELFALRRAGMMQWPQRRTSALALLS